MGLNKGAFLKCGFFLSMSTRQRIKKLFPELKAYANALVNGSHIAEDLVQEAIARALQAKKIPDDLQGLRPWLFRIVRNVHIDSLRREKIQRDYSLEQEKLLNDGAGFYPVVLEEILVREALTQLNAVEREILYLIDVLEFKYSEAAIVLSVPEGTIMSRISRARRALLTKVEQSNVTPFRSKV
ncbi:RNA polymerase sigma factor [Sneathiella aquimaris]|uniref:RNA polymerase sigma factor n=1 Tax=Sneathiella aquimaris TaxID=2599305 RepID=UPI00146B2BA1|nr:RNA polymerase sigma factor [Sneathiella aquimaris]